MKIRNGDTPIQLPSIVKTGDAITARWANGIRTAIQRLRDRTPVIVGGSKRGALPPFYPIMDGDAAFIISDGFVLDFVGGETNTDALKKYFPTGISEGNEIGGERISTGIADGQYIYIKVTVDSSGTCTAYELTVSADDKDSENPTYGEASGDGVFWFKIAQFIDDELILHLAGNHITMRARGYNLDMHVFQLYLDAGVLQAVRDWYLCWRNGDYVGKFDSEGDLPAAIGQLDTSNSTYIGEEPPPP